MVRAGLLSAAAWGLLVFQGKARSLGDRGRDWFPELGAKTECQQGQKDLGFRQWVSLAGDRQQVALVLAPPPPTQAQFQQRLAERSVGWETGRLIFCRKQVPFGSPAPCGEWA